MSKYGLFQECKGGSIYNNDAILLFIQKVKMAEQKNAVLNSTQDYIKTYWKHTGDLQKTFLQSRL